MGPIPGRSARVKPVQHVVAQLELSGLESRRILLPGYRAQMAALWGGALIWVALCRPSGDSERNLGDLSLRSTQIEMFPCRT